MTFLVLLPLTSLFHSEVLILHVQNSDAPSLFSTHQESIVPVFKLLLNLATPTLATGFCFANPKIPGVIPAQPFLRPFFAPQNSRVGV